MPTAGETWYLTIPEWRGLSRSEYPYQFAEDVVIRYIDFYDARDLESKVAYLSTLSFNGTSAYMTVNGENIAGAWDTLKVGFNPVNPTDPNSPLRLWHAFRRPANATDDAFTVTENNCSFKVSLAYRWRKTAIETVTAGSSGVTYSIGGVSRDPESGLWSYIVEKREQITTYVKEYVVNDTQFATVYEQKFYGVRKDANGEYTLTDTGTTPTGWYATGTYVQGTTYDVGVSKNENCTADVTQRKEVAKAVSDALKTAERTAFMDSEASTDSNQTAAVVGLVDVAAGVRKIQTAELNTDATFNNREEVRTARSVTDASKTVRVDQFESVTSATDRNQSAAVAGAVEAAGGVITEQTAEENENGVWDNTERVTTERSVTDAATVASEERGERVTEAENANQAAAATATAFSAGTIVETSNVKTRGGLFTQRIRTAVSKLWNSRIVRKITNLYESVVETTSEGQLSALGDPPAPAGGVTTEHVSEEDKYGRFRNTIRYVTELTLANAVKRYFKTLFQTVTETEDIASSPLGDAPAATGGLVVDHRDEQTRNGLYRTRKVETQEANVADAVIRKTGTVSENVETKLERSRTSASDITEGYVAAGEPIKSRTLRKTDGDLLDEEIETATPTAYTYFEVTSRMATADGGADVYHLFFFNATAANVYSLASLTHPVGYSVSITLDMNKFGLYNGQIVFRPDIGGDTPDDSYVFIDETGKTEIEYDIVSYQGKTYLRTYTYTFNLKRDWGISTGMAEYSGAKTSKSFFHPLSKGWYIYRKVTNVSIVDTLKTSPLDIAL